MRSKLRVDNFAGIVMVIILSMIALEFLFIFSVVQNSLSSSKTGVIKVCVLYKPVIG